MTRPLQNVLGRAARGEHERSLAKRVQDSRSWPATARVGNLRDGAKEKGERVPHDAADKMELVPEAEEAQQDEERQRDLLKHGVRRSWPRKRVVK
jgi:hypothetical protein